MECHWPPCMTQLKSGLRVLTLLHFQVVVNWVIRVKIGLEIQSTTAGLCRRETTWPISTSKCDHCRPNHLNLTSGWMQRCRRMSVTVFEVMSLMASLTQTIMRFASVPEIHSGTWGHGNLINVIELSVALQQGFLLGGIRPSCWLYVTSSRSFSL